MEKNGENSYKDFIFDSLRKKERMMKIATWCIAFFEVFFIVRGFIAYAGWFTQKCYLALYFVLLISTVFSLYLLYPGRKLKQFETVYMVYAHIYNLIVGIWSIAISIIDVSRGYYPIVFITVAFSLPFFLTLYPVWNAVVIAVGLVGCIAEYVAVTENISTGYMMNLVVFAVMAGLISHLCYMSYFTNYRLRRKLEESSLRDGLTKLYNRRALDVRIQDLMAESVQCSAVMLDCDFFKKLNDTYGHSFGDECLIKIGRLLVEEFGDECYRYGGDEFMVITRLTNDKVCEKFTKVNESLKEAFGEAPVRVTAGVYNVKGTDSAQDVFIRADKALYNAKETCRGTTHIYTEAE